MGFLYHYGSVGPFFDVLFKNLQCIFRGLSEKSFFDEIDNLDALVDICISTE